MLADTGGDRPAEPPQIIGGQGRVPAFDWLRTSSRSDLGLIRRAIREHWTVDLSPRRKRRILEAVTAIMTAPDAPARVKLAAVRVLMQADQKNREQELRHG